MLIAVLASFVAGGLANAEGPAASQVSTRSSGVIITAQNIVAIQDEPLDTAGGRYDWGPAVMRCADGLYRMWWTRLGGDKGAWHPWTGTLPDGETFSFTYPDWGDRVYYAESRDGVHWHLGGEDYDGDPATFGPDAQRPLRVLDPAESREEINHIGSPSVICVGDMFYMYYEAPAAYRLRRGADGKPQVMDEYHSQTFVATSNDGKTWRRYPSDDDPQPIVRAPAANHERGQRYGLGQPSVFYDNGRFVMHYVDSCTERGDWIVRIEAEDPFFRRAKYFARSLRPYVQRGGVPAGAVARFAQTDIKPLGDWLLLIRPAYGTGRLGLLASRDGVFVADAKAKTPAEVYSQIALPDPKGAQWTERLFPRFLTDESGRVLVDDGKIVIYYTSGLGFKDKAYSWDLRRAELPVATVMKLFDIPTTQPTATRPGYVVPHF